MRENPFSHSAYAERLKSQFNVKGELGLGFYPHEHKMFGSSDKGEGERNPEIRAKFDGTLPAYRDLFELPTEIERQVDESRHDYLLVKLPKLRKGYEPKREDYYLVDHEGNAITHQGKRIFIGRKSWEELVAERQKV